MNPAPWRLWVNVLIRIAQVLSIYTVFHVFIWVGKANVNSLRQKVKSFREADNYLRINPPDGVLISSFLRCLSGILELFLCQSQDG